MKRTVLLVISVAVTVTTGCSLFSKKGSASPVKSEVTTNEPPAKWAKLPGTLEFYDEVQKVNATFRLQTFSNGELASTVSGTYSYVKGESVWHYLGADSKVQRIVECFVDRAVVKMPNTKRRRRRRRKKPEPEFKVVAEHEAKYPCVLQALVHYSGALKRNRLDHDGKVFLVNSYDYPRRRIDKVTLVKGSVTMVYSFSNVTFVPMVGQKMPWDKPAPAVKPAPATTPATKGASPATGPAKAPAVTVTKPAPAKDPKKGVPIDDEKPPM